MVLRNAGNARDCLSLMDAIDRSRCREFPSVWSHRGMFSSLSPGRTGSGAYYRFYKPVTCRYISEDEAAEQDGVDVPEHNFEVLPRILTDEKCLLASQEYLHLVGEVPKAVFSGG